MSTIEAEVAVHGSEIRNLKQSQRDIVKKLDRLEWWLIGILVMAILQLVKALHG